MLQFGINLGTKIRFTKLNWISKFCEETDFEAYNVELATDSCELDLILIDCSSIINCFEFIETIRACVSTVEKIQRQKKRSL